jgi:FSR family fosmidomycin resistance protein-like MFS transporter
VKFELANLSLNVLHGYLALYFEDVAGLTPSQTLIVVAIWTGFGLLGDLLLIPLLEKSTV